MQLFEFKFYKSYLETFEMLSNEDSWKLIKRMSNFYFNWSDEKSDSLIVEALFSQIKYTMKKSIDWKKTWWNRMVPSTDPSTAPSTDPSTDPSTKDKEKEKDKDKEKEKDNSISTKIQKIDKKENIHFAFLLTLLNQDFLEKLKDKFFLDNEEIEINLQKFKLYWTEKSYNWIKEKWQKEKTFDIQKRFYKWLENNKNYNTKKNIWITVI